MSETKILLSKNHFPVETYGVKICVKLLTLKVVKNNVDCEAVSINWFSWNPLVTQSDD